MLIPPYIKPGDTIAIVAPAKAIEVSYINHAVALWEERGYRVVLGKHVIGKDNYFSGTDAQRLTDFQEAIDEPEVKAIICARGGYGCVRLVDRINWSSMLNTPKWVVGFSDVTVFHQHLNRMGVASLHATMPLNYLDNSPAALQTLFAQLEGEAPVISSHSMYNKAGKADGILLGGNLAVLIGLIGTDSMPNYEGAILFIEDVGEYYYTIDRMFHTLKKSGILEKIAGLVVGDFSGMKDTDPPFGSSLEKLILDHLKYINIPVSFNFPLGHCNDNRALVSGSKVNLLVENQKTTLIHHK